MGGHRRPDLLGVPGRHARQVEDLVEDPRVTEVVGRHGRHERLLADLPAGRSLEGYILPETLEYEISGANATPLAVVERLLGEFGAALTQ